MATDTLTTPELAAVRIMGGRDGRYGLDRFAHLRAEAVATYNEAYDAAAAERRTVKVGDCDRCLAAPVVVVPDPETGGWSCLTRC